METIIAEAIFQNGMIKVLTDVPLEENERIRLRIERGPRKARKRDRKLIRLHGIWKDYLTPTEKNGDWVSATLAEIRRESGVSQGMQNQTLHYRREAL